MLLKNLAKKKLFFTTKIFTKGYHPLLIYGYKFIFIKGYILKDFLSISEFYEEYSSDTLEIKLSNNKISKIHQCLECQKILPSASKLKVHIENVHLGLRKHKCHLCIKSYSLDSDLKKHIKTNHEGVRDHNCEICGRGFSRLDKLKMHIQSIHEGIKMIKRVTCDLCNKEFCGK